MGALFHGGVRGDLSQRARRGAGALWRGIQRDGDLALKPSNELPHPT